MTKMEKDKMMEYEERLSEAAHSMDMSHEHADSWRGKSLRKSKCCNSELMCPVHEHLFLCNACKRQVDEYGFETWYSECDECEVEEEKDNLIGYIAKLENELSAFVGSSERRVYMKKFPRFCDKDMALRLNILRRIVIELSCLLPTPDNE